MLCFLLHLKSFSRRVFSAFFPFLMFNSHKFQDMNSSIALTNLAAVLTQPVLTNDQTNFVDIGASEVVPNPSGIDFLHFNFFLH
jgi:hypothetical protein